MLADGKCHLGTLTGADRKRPLTRRHPFNRVRWDDQGKEGKGIAADKSPAHLGQRGNHFARPDMKTVRADRKSVV